MLILKIGRLLTRIRGFFRRSGRHLKIAGLVHIHKFLKNGADLDLPELHLGLPELHLLHKSGTVTEAVPQTHILLKTCSIGNVQLSMR